METGYNKYNLFFINKKGAKYEEVITKCKSGGGAFSADLWQEGCKSSLIQ